MPLLTIVLVLVAIGVLLALINRFGPPYIDSKFLKLINVVVVIAVVIWLLKVFGIWAYLNTLRV